MSIIETLGLELADSWATDAHKWLNVPYDSGLVFVRDKSNLNAAMSASAAYCVASGTRVPYLFVPEMSRRGVADLVDRTCAYARHMAEVLASAGYTVLNDVCLNQVLVSFGGPELTRRVIAGVQIASPLPVVNSQNGPLTCPPSRSSALTNRRYLVFCLGEKPGRQMVPAEAVQRT